MIISIKVSEQIEYSAGQIGREDPVSGFSEMPRPLAEVFGHSRRIAEDKGPEAGLYSLGFQFIPVMLQYCALLFAGDYLRGTVTPASRLSEHLENMVVSPSVGKWHVFSKVYAKTLASEKLDSLLGRLAGEFLEADDVNGPWFVDLVENDTERAPERYSLFGFFVLLRNRLAHRQGQMDRGAELFSEAWKTAEAFPAALRELGVLKLGRGEDGRLRLRKESDSCLLYPMMISSPGGESADSRCRINSKGLPLEPDREIPLDLLLDEADDRKLLYAGLRHILELRKKEDAPFRDVERLIASVRVEWPLLEPRKIAPEEWERRVRVLGELSLGSLTSPVPGEASLMAPNYNPQVYRAPGSWKKLDEDFMASAASVLLLAAPQGGGKSAFLAHLQEGDFQQNGSRVDTSGTEADAPRVRLLIDARRLTGGRLPTRLLESFLEERLRLDGSLREAVKLMYDRYGIVTCLMADGTNEFFLPSGSGGSAGAQPQLLLQGMLTFAAEVFHESPKALKLIVTGRQEFFEDPATEGVILQTLRICRTGLLYPRKDGEGEFYVHCLPEPDDRELEEIYNAVRKNVPTHSPHTPWENLSPEVRKLVRNPLRMRFLMHLYSGREIPPRETEHSLRSGMARRIMADPESRICILKIVEALRSAPYLDLSALEKEKNPELHRLVIDRTSDGESGLPKNRSYQQLVEQGILREEIHIEGEKRTSRVTPYNEFIFHLLETDFQAAVRPYLRKVTLRSLAAFMAAGTAVLVFYVAYVFGKYRPSEILGDFTEVPYLMLYTRIWSLLSRWEAVSNAVFFFGILFGTLLALAAYEALEKIGWELRCRIRVPDVVSYKNVAEYQDRNVRFVLPILAAGILIYAVILGIYLYFYGIDPGFFSAALITAGIIGPSIVFIVWRDYRFACILEPTRAAREALFGRRERILTLFIAAKTAGAVLLIIAAVWVSQPLTLGFIRHLAGPFAGKRIGVLMNDFQLENPAPMGTELQFLQSEKALTVRDPLRGEAGRIALGETPLPAEALRSSALHFFSGGYIRDVLLFFAGAGATLTGFLLFHSLVLLPLLYRRLELQARGFNRRLMKKL
jgi:hypothetical protein